jgi:metal-responsive CopG/Arc/MetJ family transcriptional regulator
VVPVRLDAATIDALTEKAKAEGITTRSEAIRTAIRQWTRGGTRDPHAA